jgi:hypothetical protein
MTVKKYITENESVHNLTTKTDTAYYKICLTISGTRNNLWCMPFRAHSSECMDINETRGSSLDRVVQMFLVLLITLNSLSTKITLK